MPQSRIETVIATEGPLYSRAALEAMVASFVPGLPVREGQAEDAPIVGTVEAFRVAVVDGRHRVVATVAIAPEYAGRVTPVAGSPGSLSIAVRKP